MRRLGPCVVFALLLSTELLFAAAKPHVVTFGKSMPVKLFIGPSEDRTVQINVRPLMVDARIKEFTTGEPHEVTDRLFVIRRAFRVNDNLPADEGAPVGQRKQPKWLWQRGGWLLVDRGTATIKQVALPEFDPFYSDAVWFRDYVAFCGISANSDKLYAIVTQLGQRKPILRKEIGRPSGGDEPDADCGTPVWEKQPVRVTFVPKRGEKVTYTVRGHSADVAAGSEEEE